MQLLFFKIVCVFLHRYKKSPWSSPVPGRPQQSRSDHAPSQTTAPNHAGKAAPRVGTSLHLCADKKCAGDESLLTATLLGGPCGGATGVYGRESQGDRTKTVPLPLAESENAIIPARRSASCNSILKTRSRRVAQATVLSDLEAGKRRAK